MKLAKDECGLDQVADCFYSRRNFSKPDRQPFPHCTFENETVFLEKHLPGGASYCMGRLNGDCWFLWTLNHSGNSSLIGVDRPDQTLEILMTDLDPEVMSYFYQKHPVTGEERTAEKITEISGIASLVPGSKINSWVFEPCGYSMNGILEKDQYWTIHITPEENFSYVSFETNVPQHEYETMLKKVLAVFKPKKFCMNLFWNKREGTIASTFVAKLMLDGWYSEMAIGNL